MILYIGNKLSKHGFTPTSVETLGAKLQSRYEVLLISDKKNKIARFFDAVFTIVKQRKRTSLVLIDTYSTINFYYTLLAAVVCRLFNIPYIPILHGGGLPGRLESSPWLSKVIFNHSAINISPSYYLLEAFQEKKFKVSYIPNYIETEIYPSKLRNKVRPKLLYVRSFHEIYNPSMAVKVLKTLSATYEDVTLCMVGPNKDGSQALVEGLAEELGVSDQLKITGKLSKEDWIALSADYDIFINTTNFDNLPVSVIEALCLGFPVISTKAGGLPFLIDNGKDGLLVDLDDDDAMVDWVKKLVENDDMTTQISTSAIAKGKSFEWNNIAPLWYELIDSWTVNQPQKVL